MCRHEKQHCARCGEPLPVWEQDGRVPHLSQINGVRKAYCSYHCYLLAIGFYKKDGDAVLTRTS